MAAIKAEDVLISACGGGHLFSDGGFIIGFIGKTDGEGFDGILTHGRGEAEDGAAIHPAGEIAANRHIRLQAKIDRFRQFLADGFDALFFCDRGFVGLCIGEGEIPIGAVFDLDAAAIAGEGDDVAGFDLDNIFKGGAAGHSDLHELMQEAFIIKFAWYIRMGHDDLDLRAEDDFVLAAIIIERFDAEAITDEVEAVCLFVIEREGKFTAQMFEGGIKADAGHQVEDGFTVTFCGEAVSLQGQLCADALKVVKLTIMGQQQIIIFADEGLLSAIADKVND